MTARAPARRHAGGVTPGFRQGSVAEAEGGASGSDRLDRTFAALAHPARRAMLARLAEGRATVAELGAPLTMSQPAVSKHLKVLEEAGLITRGRDAQWRPSELRAEALLEVEQWVGGFRRSWEERLDRLGAYLRTTHEDADDDAGGPT